MLQEQKAQLNEIFDHIIDQIDIPEAKYEEAEKKYKAVSEWLDRDESIITNLKKEIFVQGSFMLGTVIRPIRKDQDYDLDSVCKIELTPDKINQYQLKELVGIELKAYAKRFSLEKEIQEGKRCWTLNYSDGSKFHMDVLPAIPYSKEFKQLLFEKNFSSTKWTDEAIAITDNTKEAHEWHVSNPKGFEAWFKDRMKVTSERYFSKSEILTEKYAKIDDVPIFKLKTPLQRVIQIMKRHRDLKYGNSENKPISIIITTLAGRAYENEDNVYDALLNIIEKMDNYIENRNGEKWVVNPVNPLENFADKWKTNPVRERIFKEWLGTIKVYVNNLNVEGVELNTLTEAFSGMLGEDVTKAAFSKYGESIRQKREKGLLKASGIMVTLGNVGKTVAKHTFYGK